MLVVRHEGLQKEIGTKDLFFSYGFSYEKMFRILLRILGLLGFAFGGSEKSANCEIPCKTKRKSPTSFCRRAGRIKHHGCDTKAPDRT